jgi:uncharacterized protein (DUF1800 family)
MRIEEGRRMVRAARARALPSRRDLLKGAVVAAGAAAVATTQAPVAEASGGELPPMFRRPDPPLGAAAESLAPPTLAVIVLNRAAFGPWPGDIAAFEAGGGTDDQRLQAWVDAQLAPQTIADTDCDWRLANSGFTTLGKTLPQLWSQHYLGNPVWDVRMRPFWETQRATFIRAVYSRRQLNEVLADFWHNHFNVLGDDSTSGPVWPHYDRDVIRANMLGNFRVMLEAVATSTAMMYFLDNYTSSVAGPNENFARELFELHTLGAENYLGVGRQDDVPLDSQGRPVGYVDADVFEATRCFTGWSVANGSSGAPNVGVFYYRPNWHDRFQKRVLRIFIPQDQGDLLDGRQVLDALAYHPGTARHVCRKLCRRLIADEPGEATVQEAAQVFYTYREAPDQLARVVRTILLSAEFRSTWGAKVKRPFEVAASALRAVGAQFPFAMGNSDTNNFFWMYGNTGQPLFGRRSPDGFPDRRASWMVPNPRVGGWRLCTWVLNEAAGSVPYVDIAGQTPSTVRSANQLADFWIDRVFGRPLAAADRSAVVQFMAQGLDPNLALSWNDSVRNRVRAMVGLLLWSPEFLLR